MEPREIANDVVDGVSGAGERIHRSAWLDHAARWGLIAYGVVHLLVAWLALQMALGDRSGKASGEGALAKLSQQPLGGVLIWLVAIGLGLLVVWRLFEACFGHDDADSPWRKRTASALKAVIYGALAFAAIKVATGSSGGGDGTETMTARLLGLPGGQGLVAIAGAAVIGYAGRTAWRGWAEKFMEHLDHTSRGRGAGSAYRILGKVGYLAKGVALAIVGVLIGYAAVTHDADKSGGLDQALREVLQQPFGPVLLGVIALGIGCYGVFCFARARHLDR